MLTVQSVNSSLKGAHVILPASNGAVNCCRITEDKSERDLLISDFGDSLSPVTILDLLVSGYLDVLSTDATTLQSNCTEEAEEQRAAATAEAADAVEVELVDAVGVAAPFEEDVAGGGGVPVVELGVLPSQRLFNACSSHLTSYTCTLGRRASIKRIRTVQASYICGTCV